MGKAVLLSARLSLVHPRREVAAPMTVDRSGADDGRGCRAYRRGEACPCCGRGLLSQEGKTEPTRCAGQPLGEPPCDEKIAYWHRRWNESCEQLAEARALVRRAAPFVNAVAVMADDKTPALAWLADAATEVSTDAR